MMERCCSATKAGGEPKLYCIGERKYLVIYATYIEGEQRYSYTYTVYSIDAEADKITELKTSRGVRAYPNPVGRGEMVTVELPTAEEEAGQRTVCVTSMDGRVLLKESVAAGERTVQVPVQGMPSGVYNFTLTEDGRVVENSRIIVK